MVFTNNKLNGKVLESLDSLSEIKADIMIKSIGYQSAPINGAPFDNKRCIIPHIKGRVLDCGTLINGLYVAGWAKRGPVGIIDATLRDAKETFMVINEDIYSGALKTKPEIAQDLFPADHITYSEWQRINQYEINAGQDLNKIREKITSRNKMLNFTK